MPRMAVGIANVYLFFSFEPAVSVTKTRIEERIIF